MLTLPSLQMWTLEWNHNGTYIFEETSEQAVSWQDAVRGNTKQEVLKRTQ